jgi:hypothetical protein
MPERALDGARTSVAEGASECVEWLAALWELSEGQGTRCANPGLLALLRFAPGLDRLPAAERLRQERARARRDILIKEVVSAAYGRPSAGRALHDELCAFAAASRDLLGPAPGQIIDEARATACERVAEMAGPLDPAADLAEITGERLRLRVVLGPSVFLPPPQAGRHGVLVRATGECVAHLHFGFPLEGDVARFDINRGWLLGGAWHYAIQLYLEGCWAPIADRLRPRRDLAEAVSAVLDSRSAAADGTWTDLLQSHVSVALKCLLARRKGLPDGIHRAFARASGLVLFPWFESWLSDRRPGGVSVADHLAALPEALASERSSWERLDAARAVPPTVNLALISPRMRRASLVVPDEWSDDAVAAAAAGWRLLALPVVRYRAWLEARDPDQPVVAVGEPAGHPLVRRVLEQRGLAWASRTEGASAMVALSTPGLADAPWCVAVAVADADAAAQIHVEVILQQTSSYVLFQGATVVGGDRVPIDRLSVAG